MGVALVDVDVVFARALGATQIDAAARGNMRDAVADGRNMLQEHRQTINEQMIRA